MTCSQLNLEIAHSGCGMDNILELGKNECRHATSNVVKSRSEQGSDREKRD